MLASSECNLVISWLIGMKRARKEKCNLTKIDKRKETSKLNRQGQFSMSENESERR